MQLFDRLKTHESASRDGDRQQGPPARVCGRKSKQQKEPVSEDEHIGSCCSAGFRVEARKMLLGHSKTFYVSPAKLGNCQAIPDSH